VVKLSQLKGIPGNSVPGDARLHIIEKRKTKVHDERKLTIIDITTISTKVRIVWIIAFLKFSIK
jgi:hypothetical protein